MRDRNTNERPASTSSQRMFAGSTASGSDAFDGDALASAFEKVGVRMQLRLNQRIDPAIEASDTLYALRSGTMLIEAGGSDTPHVVFSLLYRGDIYRSGFLPPLPFARLTALDRCDVLRAKRNAIFSGSETCNEVTKCLLNRIGHLHARLALHAASLASLSGDERVASFLLELMLRLGQRKGLAVACDVPLSRKDMAAYLALNADTLSRVMSRLKSAGLVTGVGRNRLIVSDLSRLKAMSPIGDAVAALHAPFQTSRQAA